MKVFLVNLLCCLIPAQSVRHKLRKKYCGKRHQKIFVEDSVNCKMLNDGSNKIVLVAEDGSRRVVNSVPGCKFVFKDKNNYVELHEPLGALHLNVNVYSNTRIVIMPVGWRADISVTCNYNAQYSNSIVIGRGFSATGNMVVDFADGSNVVIGDDCMFSWGVCIRTGDYHTIVDKGTTTILNRNRDIVIGNHVWVSAEVLISKGALIQDNSVVGARSLVSRKFDEANVVIAGVPAKIVKRNIEWDRRRICDYIRENGL